MSETAPSIHRPTTTGPSKAHFVTSDWYERDVEAVFRPRWHYAAHVSQLPKPGSFVTFRLGDDEVVICRRSDMTLAAYYNFCRHRGFPLVTEPEGAVRKSFVCQYHGWAFSRDTGACVAATRPAEGFVKDDWPLRSAWVEDFHGLVFVSVATERPRPVAEQAQHQLDERGGVAGYDLDGMKLAASASWEVAANWKVVVENDEECFHCSLNHPQLVESYNPWSGFTVVDDLDAAHEQLWPAGDWPIVDLGLNKYGNDAVCRVPLARNDGCEGEDVMSVQMFWRPTGHLAFSPDHAWMWTVKPLGPERTLLVNHWFVNAAAEEGEDYDVDKLTWLMRTTMEQDEALCSRLQNAFKMREFALGPLNPHHQTPAIDFYAWYSACLDR